MPDENGEDGLPALDDGQREALRELVAWLRSTGSANDAEDHGYLEDARRMRAEACDAVSSVLRDHRFVAEMLPGLAEDLDSGRLLTTGWPGHVARIEALLRSTCETCRALGEEAYGYSKFGWPDGDIDLPPEAARLETVADVGSAGDRLRQLKRCPDCGTCYLYRTDYEYLVNGTEDEVFVTRLSDEETTGLLEGDALDTSSG